MKIFDVDVSAKYIFFELDGKQYSVHFRDNLRNGVHDVSVWDERGKTDARVTWAYPPLIGVVRELWRVYFPSWIKRIQQSHNR